MSFGLMGPDNYLVLNKKCYIWRKPHSAYNNRNLIPTVKHSGGSKKIWTRVKLKKSTGQYKADSLGTGT